MPIALTNGNYMFNSVGKAHRGRGLFELYGGVPSKCDQQSKFFGGGGFGKVSLPEILSLDSEHANVFLENSATKFSSSLFAQRKLTASQSASAEDNFGFGFRSSFQSPPALDSVCPRVARESQPDWPDVFILRPNLELFSISSRKLFLELSADRRRETNRWTSPAKVQPPQEVPPEPPPSKLCSFLALPSPCVLFSLLNFVTLKQLPIVSCSVNNVNIENSAADPLFCEPFVAALTKAVSVFFVLQRNLDFTAAVKSLSFHQTDLTMYVVKPCFSNFTTQFSVSLLVFCFGTSLCYLVTCVQLLVHQFSAVFRCLLMSRSTTPGLQTCAASSETEEKSRRNAVFSSARWVWLVVQPPRTVCFPWAQLFVKFDAIFLCSPLQCAVHSDRLPCARASCHDAAQPP
jgi:hypothetical protein